MGGSMKDYTNSQICALIDEHIHSERDRRILKRRLWMEFVMNHWLRNLICLTAR